MKKFSKILSVALLVALVLSLGVSSAFAADKVTISVARDESYAADSGSRSYTWHRVFTVDTNVHSTGGGVDNNGGPGAIATSVENAAYTASSAVATKLGTWSDSTNPKWTKVSGNEWFNLTPIVGTDTYSVSWVGETGATRVQAAAAWLLANAVYDESGDLNWNATDEVWTAEVDPGYYVIEGSEGGNLIAATTDITINEKNTYPTIDKEQKDEDITATEEGKIEYTKEKLDVAVGDVIDYQVPVTVPKDTYMPIVVTDTMTNGLTYIDGLTFAPALVKDTDYVVVDEDYELPDGTKPYEQDADWQIAILPTKTTLGQTINITFSATVNAAALQDTGRKNEVTLDYGNYHQEKTVEYTTYFTGIIKTANEKGGTPLEGVEFTLKEAGKEFKVKLVDGVYIPSTDTDASATVVTDAAGKIRIRGLDNDKAYTLTETKTLPGFNPLDKDVELTLTEDKGDAFTKAGTDVEGAAEWGSVINNSGTVLPSTGGIGTTIFYVVGGVLVLAAIILLVTKKRMSE